MIITEMDKLTLDENCFINGDCMEGMKRLPDKCIDLAIVDPPYGINVGQSAMGAGGGKAPHRNRSAILRTRRREQTMDTIRRQEEPEVFGGGSQDRRSETVRQEYGSGGNASHPKFTRRSTTATRRTPSTLKNLNGWRRKELYSAATIFLNIWAQLNA